MSKKNNSYYVVEYDDGEMFKDGCACILKDLFKSLESAKNYIKGMSIEVYPEDYEESVRDKLPERLYYKEEDIDAAGNFVILLEHDKYEDYCYTSYRRFSTFTIHKVTLLD